MIPNKIEWFTKLELLSIIIDLQIPDIDKKSARDEYFSKLKEKIYQTKDINEDIIQKIIDKNLIQNPDHLVLDCLTDIFNYLTKIKFHNKSQLIIFFKYLNRHKVIYNEKKIQFLEIAPELISYIAKSCDYLPWEVIMQKCQSNDHKDEISAWAFQTLKHELPSKMGSLIITHMIQYSSPSTLSEIKDFISQSNEEYKKFFKRIFNDILSGSDILDIQVIVAVYEIAEKANIDIDMEMLGSIALDSIDAYAIVAFLYQYSKIIIEDLEYLLEIAPPSYSLYQYLLERDVSISERFKLMHPEFCEKPPAKEKFIIKSDLKGSSFTTQLQYVIDNLEKLSLMDFEEAVLSIRGSFDEEEADKLIDLISNLPLPISKSSQRTI